MGHDTAKTTEIVTVHKLMFALIFPGVAEHCELTL